MPDPHAKGWAPVRISTPHRLGTCQFGYSRRHERCHRSDARCLLRQDNLLLFEQGSALDGTVKLLLTSDPASSRAFSGVALAVPDVFAAALAGLASTSRAGDLSAFGARGATRADQSGKYRGLFD